MINLEQLVNAIDHKIQEYKEVQQVAWRIRGCLKVGKADLSQSGHRIPHIISKQIEELKH